MGEIYSALLYRSRQKSSGTQPYLNAKLVRPASRISLSRRNTQLKPYLKEKTIILFADTAEYTLTFAQKLLKWYFILKELLSVDARNVWSKYQPNRFKR